MKDGFNSHASYSKIISSNGEYNATYQGNEVGMDAPTTGNVEVRTNKNVPVYNSKSTAEIQFSSDSQFFIHRRNLDDAKLVKIELPSGREVPR